MKDGTDRPAKQVRIAEIKMCDHSCAASVNRALILPRYQDPFEDYKQRLAKKLARKTESEDAAKSATPSSGQKEDVNWFGVKVGSETSTITGGESGVGKYLNLKRPAASAPVEATKKRKLGFGNFDNF